ncbi:MAG: transposase, partial [Opitutaceae bacterium]|nr:transposase [Opitutaceae bacterium]
RQRPPTAERTRLVQRLHELSRKYPRYGFRRIAVKLRREGYQVGRKQVQKASLLGLELPIQIGIITYASNGITIHLH